MTTQRLRLVRRSRLMLAIAAFAAAFITVAELPREAVKAHAETPAAASFA